MPRYSIFVSAIYRKFTHFLVSLPSIYRKFTLYLSYVYPLSIEILYLCALYTETFTKVVNYNSSIHQSSPLTSLLSIHNNQYQCIDTIASISSSEINHEQTIPRWINHQTHLPAASHNVTVSQSVSQSVND